MANQDLLHTWWWSNAGPGIAGPMSIEQIDNNLKTARTNLVVKGKDGKELIKGWNYAVLRFLLQYCVLPDSVGNIFQDNSNYGVWKKHLNVKVNIRPLVINLADHDLKVKESPEYLKQKEIFESDLVDNLAEYLKKYSNHNQLSVIYQWPIDQNTMDELNGFDQDTADTVNKEKSLFKKTLKLRDGIKIKLSDEKITKELKVKYAKWIIGKWGKITIRDNEFFENVISEKSGNNNIEFDRVASRSKYLAFKYPERYAIYDARVIYSLNWLLFVNHANKFFPAPKGRNSLMNALDYTMPLLIKHKKINEVRDQINADIKNRLDNPAANSRAIQKLKNGLYIKNNNAYSDYCELLKSLASKLYEKDDSHALTKVEMILFAIGDREIVKEVFEYQFVHDYYCETALHPQLST